MEEEVATRRRKRTERIETSENMVAERSNNKSKKTEVIKEIDPHAAWDYRLWEENNSSSRQ